MKTVIRIVICVCLIAVAVTMAAFTLADLGRLGGGTAAEDAGAVGLTLGEYQGSVAVFEGGGRAGGVPVRVTDIALASLRDCDREMIERGYAVGSQEELLALLEDLGS